MPTIFQCWLTIHSTGPIAAVRHLGYKSLTQIPAHHNGPVSSNVRPHKHHFVAAPAENKERQMPSTPQTSCPLCLKPARIFGTTNLGRNSAFTCAGCGQFAVSARADERIRGLPDALKDDWRAKIRATKPDELFVITVGPVGSGSNFEEDRVSRHTIQSRP